MPVEEAGKLWKEVVKRVGTCRVADDEGIDSMRVYAAVKDLIDEYGLSALTIGCYPHLMGRVCLATSLLADEGIPMACEGDVHGAVAQLMLSLLTEQPTHNTDWLDPMEDGTVIFAHCGSGSFSLAEMVFPGNPLRVRFGKPVDELLEWIHDEGIGHHRMIGYGHVGEEIRAWAEIVGEGLRLVEPPVQR